MVHKLLPVPQLYWGLLPIPDAQVSETLPESLGIVVDTTAPTELSLFMDGCQILDIIQEKK